MKHWLNYLAGITSIFAFTTASTSAKGVEFEVTYKVPEKKPIYTPRVYVVVGQSLGAPMKNMGNWFHLPTICAVDDVDGDGKVKFVADSLSNKPFNELDGKYKVQAVVRIHPDWPQPENAEGNLFSDTTEVEFKAGEDKTIKLDAQNVIEAPKFKKEGRIRDFYFKSKCLSEFHERPYQMRYSVVLPKNWEKGKKYPVIVYTIGFSGVHHKVGFHVMREIGNKSKNAIILIADANCRWGHSVFADSAVNGPWGKALTEELIPHVDKEFGGAGPEHRYIMGTSSGGWASLWVMLNYPKHFAACWSTSPDPVDFHAFQELNLKDKKADSLYKDEEGNKRRFAIPRMKLFYEDLAKFERVLGPGGQLKSFASVFSKRMDDGSPEMWYDEKSGDISQKVVDSWKPYDISELMRKNAKTLIPQVKGKLNIGVQETDIFLLDPAVRLLEKQCKELGYDAKFTYFKGSGHHFPRAGADPMMEEIMKRWEKAFPPKPAKELVPAND